MQAQKQAQLQCVRPRSFLRPRAVRPHKQHHACASHATRHAQPFALAPSHPCSRCASRVPPALRAPALLPCVNPSIRFVLSPGHQCALFALFSFTCINLSIRSNLSLRRRDSVVRAKNTYL
eukprot:4374876-Pleurochrysis_carterae.AAC.1